MLFSHKAAWAKLCYSAVSYFALGQRPLSPESACGEHAWRPPTLLKIGRRSPSDGGAGNGGCRDRPSRLTEGDVRPIPTPSIVPMHGCSATGTCVFLSAEASRPLRRLNRGNRKVLERPSEVPQPICKRIIRKAMNRFALRPRNLYPRTSVARPPSEPNFQLTSATPDFVLRSAN
jgi:hypothetical protein